MQVLAVRELAFLQIARIFAEKIALRKLFAKSLFVWVQLIWGSFVQRVDFNCEVIKLVEHNVFALPAFLFVVWNVLADFFCSAWLPSCNFVFNLAQHFFKLGSGDWLRGRREACGVFVTTRRRLLQQQSYLLLLLCVVGVDHRQPALLEVQLRRLKRVFSPPTPLGLCWSDIFHF